MSIAEVARRAGVSATTVSNIINNKRKASEATVLRVRSAMEEIHYLPRPPSQRPGRKSIAHQKNAVGLRKIALVIPNCGLAQFQNPIYSILISAISQAAYERGASMELCRIPNRGQLPENIANGKMDGVIFVLKEGAGPYIDAIKKTPKVGILGDTDLNIDFVTCDNEKMGRLALDYLKNLGVENYACLYDSDHDAQWKRALAFERKAEREGLSIHLEGGKQFPMIDDHLHQPGIAKVEPVLDALLKKVKKPFGLFCPMDLITTAVHPLLYKKGITPGKDVWLVSCDNVIPYLINLSPRPAEIDLHLEAMALRALDQLVWRMQNPSAPFNMISVEPLLITPEGVEAEIEEAPAMA